MLFGKLFKKELGGMKPPQKFYFFILKRTDKNLFYC